MSTNTDEPAGLVHRIRYSLRNRLLALLSLSLAILLAVTAKIVFVTSEHEMHEILDGQMVTLGRALFAVVALELRRGDEERLPEALDQYVRQRRASGDWRGEHPDEDIYDASFYLQLARGDNTIVFTSQLPPVHRDANRTGFFRTESDGEQWHLFGLYDPESDYYFYVGQTTHVRQELSEESTAHLVMPLTLGGFMVLLAVWYGTRYALDPLEQLRVRIDQRAADDTRPIDTRRELIEFRPLIDALNSLFLRLQRMVANERRFSADAAHELRTPLAGIAANLDAARSFPADAAQATYLDNIGTCVDNATRVSESLLVLSRLESASSAEHFVEDQLELGALVEEEIARFRISHPAVAHRLQVEHADSGALPLRAPQSLISVLLRNLVENALRYGGDGTVTVRIEREPVSLLVLDTGPGIPEDALAQVFERFEQLPGQRAAGTGLGLSIVQRIVDYLGARLALSNRPGGGLQARVDFSSGKGLTES